MGQIIWHHLSEDRQGHSSDDIDKLGDHVNYMEVLVKAAAEFRGTDPLEIRAFIGILIYMDIEQLPSICDYFHMID